METTRQEAVTGEDRAQHRETVEGGVGSQEQDDHRTDDHDVEARFERVVEDGARQLTNNRHLLFNSVSMRIDEM